jgi:hypothetical protein
MQTDAIWEENSIASYPISRIKKVKSEMQADPQKNQMKTFVQPLNRLFLTRLLLEHYKYENNHYA